MKFGNKDFSEYWKIIMIPTYILIGWSVLSLILALVSFTLYTTIVSPTTGWILMAAVFGFVGWTTVKDHKYTVGIAAWAGAITGAITGFIGAITSIIMFYFAPEIIMNIAMQSAQQPGVDAAALQGFIEIGMYIALVTGPLISGLVGAGIAALAAFIATKV